MYSQNNEEEIIIEFFKNKMDGFFIDIGSFDPFIFSNVRKLFENGWGGVMIEPSEICFQKLNNEYKDKDNITLIKKAVVCDGNDKIKFYDSYGDAVSSTNYRHTIKWSSVNFNETEVETINISELIEKYGNKCNFINIDVESSNYEIFENLPDWFLEKVDLICIEHDNFHEQIEDKLRQFGFIKLLFNGENIIMGKNGNGNGNI